MRTIIKVLDVDAFAELLDVNCSICDVLEAWREFKRLPGSVAVRSDRVSAHGEPSHFFPEFSILQLFS